MLLPMGCLAPPTPPAPPPSTGSAPRSEDDVLAVLNEGHRASRANRYEEALRLARQGLAMTREVRVTPNMVAALYELEGHCLFMLDDIDAQRAFAAALERFEKLPGAEREVARVSSALAMSLLLPVMELERVEALLRRAIDLRARFEPANSADLVRDYSYLVELYHQECRTAEALPLLDKAEALVERQPPDPYQSAIWFRLRANFAANQGDLAGAVAWEKRALDEISRLELTEPAASFMSVDLELLAEHELARGNYVEALAYVERRAELAGKRHPSDFETADLAEAMHWAYLARKDARLAEHDAKHGFVATRVGEELFPPKLPQAGACHPELAKPPVGKLHRYSAVVRRAEACLKESKRAEHERIAFLMRVQAGKVIAVEALGRRAETPVLRCVADAVLGYEHATEKYNEFAYVSVE